MDVMERKDFLENLDVLISVISRLHAETSDTWSKMGSEQPNLKSLQVRDIFEEDLFPTITAYDMFVSSMDLDKTIGSYEREEFEVKSRVKMINSIQSKIERYTNMSHEGKVSINKCFNDLLGVRVIANCDITHEEICGHVRNTFDMKCIDSSKTDPETGEPTYIATHIYFRTGNKDFPWELQIWLTKNAERNFASHEKYKQGYKVWDTDNGGGP